VVNSSLLVIGTAKIPEEYLVLIVTLKRYWENISP